MLVLFSCSWYILIQKNVIFIRLCKTPGKKFLCVAMLRVKFVWFISGLLKAAHLCDWPRNAHCKYGVVDLKPTDLPTVRPTPTTKPTHPPTWSTQTTLSSSGDVISSTASLPTVQPIIPPHGGTLSGKHVPFLTCTKYVCIFK